MSVYSVSLKYFNSFFYYRNFVLLLGTKGAAVKSALVRLRETHDSLSRTELSVADHLLQNPDSAAELSIHELARRTYSSPSTIVRLCRKLGFDGYKDFRRAVILDLATHQQSLAEASGNIAFSDDLGEIVETVSGKNIASIVDAKALIDLETLQRCTELVRESRVILLFGIGASLCAAHDAYLKFLRVGKPCVVNDDWHSQYLQARNSAPEDLGIIISYSGQTVELVECMKLMSENRTPMIAITRCVPSPVAKLADYKLYTTSNESTFRSGAMSSRISQLNIIDILYTAYVNDAHCHDTELFSRTQMPKPPL